MRRRAAGPRLVSPERGPFETSPCSLSWATSRFGKTGPVRAALHPVTAIAFFDNERTRALAAQSSQAADSPGLKRSPASIVLRASSRSLPALPQIVGRRENENPLDLLCETWSKVPNVASKKVRCSNLHRCKENWSVHVGQGKAGRSCHGRGRGDARTAVGTLSGTHLVEYLR